MSQDDSSENTINPDSPMTGTAGQPEISLEKMATQEIKRPLLVDKYIVSEIQADSLLAPMDQVYSPNMQLYGIRYVYKFISNATRSFFNNMRTHLPTRQEISEGLRNENYKIGDLDKILQYLVKKTPPNPAFCIQYHAALFEGEKLMLKPVYLAGNENIEKIVDKSDEVSARNIAQRASSLQPWNDRTTQGEFLTEKINAGKFHETYFLGYFRFDDQVMTDECREIYERRILPLLRGRSEIVYLDIPLSLQLDEPGDEAILLINDHRDLKFRYEFLSGKLIAGAKKIALNESFTDGSREAAWQVRKALESLKRSKSPDSMKHLGASVLSYFKKPGTLRQIAIEIFLLKDRADEIIRQEIETRESRNAMYLDLLLKRIRTRKWLTMIPASFYPQEVFAKALAKPEILGIKKSGFDLGVKEDYYCMIELPLVNSLLRAANWFELAIIEDILSANQLSSKEFYKRALYKKKKNIIFLIMNPFIYLFRSIFTRKRRFIENTFRQEIDSKGKTYLNGLRESFETSGIHEADFGSERQLKTKPTAKQVLTKKALDILFDDPAPSSKWLNEIEYRERIVKIARTLRQDDSYPQYADKTDEAIIADIEPFLKEELIEDIYSGSLPSGLDHRGKKFTRKIYSPKSIKDQPIVYESIREEMEHESNSYGSKDLVEYYKARMKLFSESSMEKIRSAERLKKEAEQKSKLTRESSAPEKGTILKQDRTARDKTAEGKSSRIFFLKTKKDKKVPVTGANLTSQQKIERTAGTLASEMKEKYITKKKYTGSNLFPITSLKIEEMLDIEHGTLSLFSNENPRDFTNNFVIIKAGKQFYYFPRNFFDSSRDKIIKFYEELVKHEAGLSLPNGEIIHKAQDIISAIKSKRSGK